MKIIKLERLLQPVVVFQLPTNNTCHKIKRSPVHMFVQGKSMIQYPTNVGTTYAPIPFKVKILGCFVDIDKERMASLVHKADENRFFNYKQDSTAALTSAQGSFVSALLDEGMTLTNPYQRAMQKEVESAAEAQAIQDAYYEAENYVLNLGNLYVCLEIK